MKTNKLFLYPILFLTCLTILNGCKKKEDDPEPTPTPAVKPEWANVIFFRYAINGLTYQYGVPNGGLEVYPIQNHSFDGSGNNIYRYGTFMRDQAGSNTKMGVFMIYHKNGALTDTEFDALTTPGYKSYVAPNGLNPYGFEITWGQGNELLADQYSTAKQPGTQTENYIEVLDRFIDVEGGYRTAYLKIRYACNLYKPGATPSSHTFTNGQMVVKIPMMN